MANNAKSTRNATRGGIESFTYGAEGGTNDVFRIMNAFFKAEQQTAGNKPYSKFRTGIQDFLESTKYVPKTNIFDYPASATIEFENNTKPIEKPDLNNLGISPQDKKVLKLLRKTNTASTKDGTNLVLEHIVISSRDIFVLSGAPWKPYSAAAHIPGDKENFPFFSKIKHIKPKELVVLEALYIVTIGYPDLIMSATEQKFNEIKNAFVQNNLFVDGDIAPLSQQSIAKVNFCMRKIFSVFNYKTIKAFKSFLTGTKIDGQKVGWWSTWGKGVGLGVDSALSAPAAGGMIHKKVYTIKEVLYLAIDDWDKFLFPFDVAPFNVETINACFKKYLTGSLCKIYDITRAAPGAAAADAVDIAVFTAAAAAAAAAPPPIDVLTYPAGITAYADTTLANKDAQGLFLAYSVNNLNKLNILEGFLRADPAVPENQSNFCFFTGLLNCLHLFLNTDALLVYRHRTPAAPAAAAVGPAAIAAVAAAAAQPALAQLNPPLVPNPGASNPVNAPYGDGLKPILKKAYDDNMRGLVYGKELNPGLKRIISSWNIFILNTLKGNFIGTAFPTEQNTSITPIKRSFYKYLTSLRRDYNDLNGTFQVGNFLLVEDTNVGVEAAAAGAGRRGGAAVAWAGLQAGSLEQIRAASALGAFTGVVPAASRRNTRRNLRRNRRNTRR
jgi:hypothetical protein